MELLKAPPPLQLTGNLSEQWKRFKQKFDLFIVATTTKEQPRTEAAKAALLLSVAGDEALDVFNTFKFEAQESKEDYSTIVQKFESYCSEVSNEVHERYLFRSRKQADGEPFEKFLRDLKKQAAQCNFGEQRDSMIRDQIVFGTNNSKLREKMLREQQLTLVKAEEFCKVAESVAQRNEVWRATDSHIDAIAGPANVPKSRNAQDGNKQYRCTKCDRRHRPRQCPAYGKKCNICHLPNHFAVCCRETSKIAEVSKDDFDDNFDILEVGVGNRNVKDWLVEAEVKGKKLSFKVDTGSQASLLPFSAYRKMRAAGPLTAATSVLRAYNGGVITHFGTTSQEVTVGNTSATVQFFVVKHGSQAILGLEASEALGLFQRTVATVSASTDYEAVTHFQHLFQGLGCLKQPYSMVLQPTAVPVVQPARRIPLSLRGPVQEELRRLEREAIIVKENDPTDWVSPLVTVKKKDGRIRICMDPRKINEHIKREHFQLPRREDMEGELAGATIFSCLDANSGFHQIALDEQTSKICTFATPFGRYRYLRLPFGIASAPEIFQRTMTQVFEGLPGVHVYIDDILVWGANKQEHDQRLIAVMKAAEKAGLTFNAKKCRFGVTEIQFLGDIIGRDGISPDPKLIKSLLETPEPQNKCDVQRMLGVINYFAKYVPRLSERTALLRALIKAQSVFEWTENHRKEWKGITQILTTTPVLAIFDPQRQSKITCDASKDGMGAALLQCYDGDKWRPVAYASRALTQAEQRYAQIEKETLSISFGCEKFHHFVYGHKVFIETDHKPLLSIAAKGICDMPPRLQRFFLRLLKYDFVLQYVPGKHLVLADMLSRSSPASHEDIAGAADDVEVHAVQVLGYLVTDATRQKLVQETARDDYLSTVISSLSSGESLQGELKPFSSELSVVDGILLKGTKVVIPKSMRREILGRIHTGHLGLQKCKERARRLVFWPGLSSDISLLIQSCSTCRKFSYKQPKEPLLMRPIPLCAWVRVGVDIFSFGGSSYVVAFDALSNFPEVQKLQDTTARTTISALSAMFARYGVPLEVCTDNGPQFSSYEFAEFARKYDFAHVTSSPHFPQSNGLAEKGVQIVKRLLKKSEDSHEDFWLGLLAYRSTPLVDGRSPGELLQGRRLRSNVPDFGDVQPTSVKKHRQNNDGKHLSPLDKGSIVRLRDATWSPKGIVMGRTSPRSYDVETEGGRVFRRNRRHILQTREQWTADESDDDDCGSSESMSADSSASTSVDVTPCQPTHPHPQASSADGPTPTAAHHVPSPPRSTLVPRRSGRTSKPPQRLGYDTSFNQVT
ncbi:uncharacterized protein K02A2.6-like [Dermacentor silvarum]|uniref:uncharacterized protein K02A2.6-like n=1 Tax=Dermacentor silvarum TaxID=543639 RepID=UPI002100EF19|nr:uncharacterized protein K02A2.6-like [Dermacentor silvarum]